MAVLNGAHSSSGQVPNRPRKAPGTSGLGHATPVATATKNVAEARAGVRSGRRGAVIWPAREPRNPRRAACERARIDRARPRPTSPWRVAARAALTAAALAFSGSPAVGFGALADQPSAEQGSEAQHLRHFCRAAPALPTPALTRAAALAPAAPLPRIAPACARSPYRPVLACGCHPTATPGAGAHGPCVGRTSAGGRGTPCRGQGKSRRRRRGYRGHAADLPNPRGAYATVPRIFSPGKPQDGRSLWGRLVYLPAREASQRLAVAQRQRHSGG
jgi:hypothetical protein